MVVPLDRVEEVVGAGLKQGGHAVGFDRGWRRRRRRPDGAVAVEVLVEDGLEVLQRRAGARDAAGEIGDVVAVAVGAPDVEEPGGTDCRRRRRIRFRHARRRPVPSRPTCRR